MIDGSTPHRQPCPGARTGFVFICPGRHEASRGYPCAAGTGANLNRVLAVLHARRPDRFASADRRAYVITNAWQAVEYPALTGRSVPTEAEVLAPANLARLAAEVHTVERHPQLANGARRVLDSLNVCNVVVHFGDGSLGWPDCAPYQGILVTAAAPSLAQALLEQLADSGYLVAPVGGHGSQD